MGDVTGVICQTLRHGVDHSTAIEAVDDEMRALTTVGPAPPWAKTAAAAAAAASTEKPPRSTTKDEGDLAAGMAAARAGDSTVLDAMVAAGRVEALPDPGLEAARSGDVAGGSLRTSTLYRL